MLAELDHLRRDHRHAVGLIGIVGEIFLVIILGDREIINSGHFCDNEAVPNMLGIQLADEVFGGFFLLR